jgi:hypothetical protein
MFNAVMLRAKNGWFEKALREYFEKAPQYWPERNLPKSRPSQL